MRGGEGCGVSANEYSCAHHVTRNPNKLWRSTSLFNLWLRGREYGLDFIASVKMGDPSCLQTGLPGGGWEWRGPPAAAPHPVHQADAAAALRVRRRLVPYHEAVEAGREGDGGGGRGRRRPLGILLAARPGHGSARLSQPTRPVQGGVAAGRGARQNTCLVPSPGRGGGGRRGRDGIQLPGTHQHHRAPPTATPPKARPCREGRWRGAGGGQH